MTRRAMLVLGCLAAAAPGPAEAQSADSVLTLRKVASFSRAASVSVEPSGGILVADAGRDVVLRLDSDGRLAEAIGGPGSGAARFDGPGGIDATNGFILLVADTGNGRVQRFARDGRFLEWLPLWSDPDRREEGPEYLERDQRPMPGADGRPTDVVSTDDGRLFVIESISATIRTWDRERRPGEAIGAGVGDALPVRPVALASDGERVYVADAALPGVVVLDRFGRPTRSFGVGVADGIRSVATGRGCIWMLAAAGIAAFTPDGMLVATFGLPVPESAVDLAVRNEDVYVLTAEALYRATAGCGPQP